MKYKLKKLDQLSGEGASIYTVVIQGEKDSVFEQFIKEYKEEYTDEINSIVNRLEDIGLEVGARESFFKHNEGKYGDLVCALYDTPNADLRLYCIRYGATTVILGGGGPKTTRSWQQDVNLSKHATQMIMLSADITRKLKDGDLDWSDDKYDFEGNFDFTEEED